MCEVKSKSELPKDSLLPQTDSVSDGLKYLGLVPTLLYISLVIDSPVKQKGARVPRKPSESGMLG